MWTERLLQVVLADDTPPLLRAAAGATLAGTTTKQVVSPYQFSALREIFCKAQSAMLIVLAWQHASCRPAAKDMPASSCCREHCVRCTADLAAAEGPEGTAVAIAWLGEVLIVLSRSVTAYYAVRALPQQPPPTAVPASSSRQVLSS